MLTFKQKVHLVVQVILCMGQNCMSRKMHFCSCIKWQLEKFLFTNYKYWFEYFFSRELREFKFNINKKKG